MAGFLFSYNKKMNKKYNVAIISLLLIISYFVYGKVTDNIAEKNNFLKQQTIIQQQENKTQALKDAIRNQPFPLAGMDNGIIDTGLTDETNQKTYSIGSNPAITDQGIKIFITNSYNFGTKVTSNEYDYNYYAPSQEAKGIYLEVNLTIENTNKKPVTSNISNIKLSTKDGYEYFPIRQNRDCGATPFQYTKNDEVVGGMNPDAICKVKLLFDVASTTSNFSIKFN